MDNTSTPQQPPYNVEQVAALLGICTNTVRTLEKKGELPSIRLGKRILFPRPPIDRLRNGEAA